MTEEKIETGEYTQEELDVMTDVLRQLIQIIEKFYPNTKHNFDSKIYLMSKMLTFILLKFSSFESEKEKKILNRLLNDMIDEVKDRISKWPEFLKNHELEEL